MTDHIDPDAWRRLEWTGMRVPPGCGTPGPSDRERAYQKHKATTGDRPAADPFRVPVWKPWRPCEACMQAIGLVPLPGYSTWVDSLPEGHQGRYTGHGFPNRYNAEEWQKAEQRRIRESCRTGGAPAHPSDTAHLAFLAALAKAPASEYRHTEVEEKAA